MKQKIILPDTSLCAIVRDEIMNPAGGIVDFVDSTAPYLEQAVIVDTGSLDGTREKLEELKSEHPNLAVYDRAFDNYASSRNFSLSKVKTKRALVLDADERLTEKDFEKLKDIIDKNPEGYIRFDFLGIGPDYAWGTNGHNPRLFPVNGVRYVNEVAGHLEFLLKEGARFNFFDMIYSGLEIKHFNPDEEGIICKNRDWYDKVMFDNNPKAPSEVLTFHKWKKLNPRREEYRK